MLVSGSKYHTVRMGRVNGLHEVPEFALSMVKAMGGWFPLRHSRAFTSLAAC